MFLSLLLPVTFGYIYCCILITYFSQWSKPAFKDFWPLRGRESQNTNKKYDLENVEASLIVCKCLLLQQNQQNTEQHEHPSVTCVSVPLMIVSCSEYVAVFSCKLFEFLWKLLVFCALSFDVSGRQLNPSPVWLIQSRFDQKLSRHEY